MVFVVLCPGTPEGSTGSGSGFQRLRRRDKSLNTHTTDWEKPEIEPLNTYVTHLIQRMVYFSNCLN